MSKSEVAWVNPVHKGMVVTPDGFTMTNAKAAIIGLKSVPWPLDVEKTATLHPYEANTVVLARGATADKAAAIKAGFVIIDAVAATHAPSAHSAWRSAVMSLPDARERPAATAELLTSQSHNTLSLMDARAFLRGLPTELPDEVPNMTTQQDDPRAARLAEIQGSVSAFNRSMGFSSAKPPSVSASTVDPVRLKRLAEIRHTALSMRSDTASRREANNLKYALDSHARTGSPLAGFLAQFSVDTNFLNRS